MILGLDHLALICSSEESVRFYRRLGFEEFSRQDRGRDVLVMMAGHGVTLEMFIDPTHPPRADRPEAMGLRHLALRVDDVEGTLAELDITAELILEIRGRRSALFKDPDGLPIELHE